MPPTINFSGIASGIDSSALIQAILDQQRNARISPLQEAISRYRETNESFSELKNLLADLDDASQNFRSLGGGAIAKQATSSNENIITASASNSSSSGVYSLNVGQLAKNATFSFDDRYGSSSSAIDAGINDVAAAVDRTVSFTIGSGASAETVDVEMTSTTTLSSFASSFNSQSTKAMASVVNTGTSSSPSYALIITSNEEGLEEGTITLNSIGSEISIFTSNALDQAEDAEFTVDGITGTFTRSSNSVSDVIPGLSLDLQDTGAATITVSLDPETTRTRVQEFVEAYNALADYIAENDMLTRDEETEDILFGSLAGTSIDENILTSIRSAFSSSSLSGQTVNVLADLGITTQRDGSLAFDEDIFQDALASDPASVESILGNLGEALGAVDGTLAQFTRFNGLLDTATSSNQSSITDNERRIDEIEASLEKQEAALLLQFSRLEALVGSMNAQQSALAGLLP